MDTSHSTLPGISGFIGRSIVDVERALILETLQHCLGNRTRAANVLRISIRTLRNRIIKYASEGVDVPVASQVKQDGAWRRPAKVSRTLYRPLAGTR
jgi:hypothetical protein